MSSPALGRDARAEHLATRRKAGLFDFSFMGLHEFDDAEALAPLQSRDLARLAPGRIAYTLLLNEDGTVFNDATVWRLEAGRWWLFSGRRGDADWIRARARPRVRPGGHAVIALQGPRSGAILARLAGEDLVRSLRYFDLAPLRCAAGTGYAGRIGYSGELGYEVVVEERQAAAMRRALVETGGGDLRECGFDAADSLRIECGYVLFDREITGREWPEALGLARLVERRGARPSPSPTRLVGLQIEPPAFASRPRPWLPPARITSECDSPTLGRRVGLGFVAVADSRPGSMVTVQDGRRAVVARLPFYDPMRRLPRATPL